MTDCLSAATVDGFRGIALYPHVPFSSILRLASCGSSYIIKNLLCERKKIIMSKNEFLRKKMQIYNIDAFSKHVDCLLPCLAHPVKVDLNK